ncbi:MAG: OadG family protein [Thermoanaerobaculia bacterium]|nr:OadG family protein [Thermoanaerobaculia bacterium]
MDHNFGLEITLVGLTVVFVALLVIVGAVALMRRLDERWQKSEEAADEAAFGKSPNIDYTTVVLLSAAVATIFLGRARIRSVRRLLPTDFVASPWSVTGRSVLQGSHVISKHTPRS